jgi:hypothetical protein
MWIPQPRAATLKSFAWPLKSYFVLPPAVHSAHSSCRHLPLLREAKRIGGRERLCCLQVDALRAIDQLAAHSDAAVLISVAHTIQILEEDEVMKNPPLGQPPSTELHVFVKVISGLAKKVDPAIREAVITVLRKRATNPGAAIDLFLAPFNNLVGSLCADSEPSTVLAAEVAADALGRVAATGLLKSIPGTQTLVAIVKMVRHLVRLSKLCPALGNLLSSVDNAANALLEVCANTLSITRRVQRLARRRLATRASSGSTAVAEEPLVERWVRAYTNALAGVPGTHCRRYFIFGDPEATQHRPCHALPLCNANLPLSREQVEAMAKAGVFDVGVYILLAEGSESFLGMSEFLANADDEGQGGLQGVCEQACSLDFDSQSQSMQQMLAGLQHELEQARTSHKTSEAGVHTVYLDDWYQDDISEVDSAPQEESQRHEDAGAAEAILESTQKSSVAAVERDSQRVATDVRLDPHSDIRPELAMLVSGQEMLVTMLRQFEARSERDRHNFEQEMLNRMSLLQGEIQRHVSMQQDQEARLALALAENRRLLSQVAELKEQAIRIQQEADESNRRLQEQRNSTPNELAMYQGFSRKLERIEHAMSSLHSTIEELSEHLPKPPGSNDADMASKEEAVDQLRQLIGTLRDEQGVSRREHQQLLEHIRILMSPRKVAESTLGPTRQADQANTASAEQALRRHELAADAVQRHVGDNSDLSSRCDSQQTTQDVQQTTRDVQQTTHEVQQTTHSVQRTTHIATHDLNAAATALREMREPDQRELPSSIGPRELPSTIGPRPGFGELPSTIGPRPGFAPGTVDGLSDSFRSAARFGDSARIGQQVPALPSYALRPQTSDFLQNFQRIKHDWQRMKGPREVSPTTSPLRDFPRTFGGADISVAEHDVSRRACLPPDSQFRPSAALSILESMRSHDASLEGFGTSSLHGHLDLNARRLDQLVGKSPPTARLQSRDYMEPLREYKGRSYQLESPSYFQ